LVISSGATLSIFFVEKEHLFRVSLNQVEAVLLVMFSEAAAVASHYVLSV